MHQGYGLTEAVAGRHLDPVQRPTAKPGSVGSALPGVEVRLRDDAVSEPEGEDPGEILVRGDNLFSGYWPDGADGPDEDGWCATGDVGYLDGDGDLFLVDRLKELVIVSGLQRLPDRGRGGASASVDEVAEAAVIGARTTGTGEAVVAYVGAATGRRGPQPRLDELVREHCRPPAGPLQAAEPVARRRRPAAHRHRQGRQGAAAGHAHRRRTLGLMRVSARRRGSARVLLYTRPGCHLCDDARRGLDAVCAELGESFEEVDIDASEDLPRPRSARRSRSPSSTAASTTTGGSTPTASAARCV